MKKQPDLFNQIWLALLVEKRKGYDMGVFFIDHGSPVWFIARIVFNEGGIDENEVRALFLRHSID